MNLENILYNIFLLKNLYIPIKKLRHFQQILKSKLENLLIMILEESENIETLSIFSLKYI